MGDYVPGFIRTYVPLLVTVIVTWLTSINVEVTTETSTMLATVIGALAGAAYYALVRVLEAKFPWVGKLLGSTKTPVYVPPQVVVEAKTAVAAVVAAAQPIDPVPAPATV